MGDGQTTERSGVRLDARAVRVLAHPLRTQLLSALRGQGTATATELAALLNTNTGASSYHLRALESVGLVADTGEGLGRRRVWRATTDFHSWVPSDFADDEDAKSALGWLQREYIRRLAEEAAEWLDAQDGWPSEWTDVAGLGDEVLALTAAQVKELEQEVVALLERYRVRGADDPHAERVRVYYHVSPLDPRRAAVRRATVADDGPAV